MRKIYLAAQSKEMLKSWANVAFAVSSSVGGFGSTTYGNSAPAGTGFGAGGSGRVCDNVLCRGGNAVAGVVTIRCRIA